MTKSYYAQKLNAQRLRRAYEIAGARVRQYLQAEIDHLAGFVKPGDRILELGCGYGRVLAPLSGIAGKGWGIDNSDANVQLALDENPELDIRVMDAAHLTFSKGTFDLVFGVQNFISACKVPPEQLLAESLRVIRPGGHLLLSSYAAQFWTHRMEWFRRQAEEGLIGAIDEDASKNGVIVGLDGFKATTFSPDAFKDLTASMGITATIKTVDESSVFCEIKVSEDE